MTLSFSLQRMREWLGSDDPLVVSLLEKDSPDSLAARLVAETKLDDPAVRRQLWLGGKAAVDASRDPMLEFARSIDGESRRLRRQFEDEVEAPIAAASARIAAARFKAFGTHVYPDASFTLRLNYGKVQGWTENGKSVDPLTRLDRAFERATGSAPFKIPDSWMAAKDRLDMHTPFCIATNSDIVGGNSGSPLLDSQGRIVGLIFDGNIHSISGDLLVRRGEESGDCGASGDHSRGARQGVRRKITIGGDRNAMSDIKDRSAERTRRIRRGHADAAADHLGRRIFVAGRRRRGRAASRRQRHRRLRGARHRLRPRSHR